MAPPAWSPCSFASRNFRARPRTASPPPKPSRLVENAIRDPFDHWLAGNHLQANKLLDFVIERAEERIRRRQEKEIARKTRFASCAFPGSLPTAAIPPRKGPKSSSWRATRRGFGQAGARIAPRRRSCRCAARSSMWPQREKTSFRRISNFQTFCRRSASVPARITARRTFATSG